MLYYLSALRHLKVVSKASPDSRLRMLAGFSHSGGSICRPPDQSFKFADCVFEPVPSIVAVVVPSIHHRPRRLAEFVIRRCALHDGRMNFRYLLFSFFGHIATTFCSGKDAHMPVAAPDCGYDLPPVLAVRIEHLTQVIGPSRL